MNILTRFQKILSNSKVRRQLYYIYALVAFIPILLIGIFLIVNTRTLLLDHYRSQVESDNLRVKSIMFDVTTNFFNMSEELAFDKDLQNLLVTQYATMPDASNKWNNYNKITHYINTNTALTSITIFTTNPTSTLNEYISYVTEDIKQSHWYQKAITQTSGFWLSSPSFDSGKNQSTELTFIRKIPLLQTNYSAVMVFKMSNNYIKNRVENNSFFTAISTNEDPVFFSTNRNLQGAALPVYVDYEKSYYQHTGILKYKDKDVMGSISTLLPYRSEDKLYICSLNFGALYAARRVITICFILVFFAVVIPLIIIAFFIRYFSSRVGTLRKAMYKASHADYDILDSFHGDDELSETFFDLKIIIQTIKEKDAKMYESKITEKELTNQQQQMEFKMLASQINPHFLYNTLETIRMKAFTEGNREVASAIKLLGKSMHYVLENTGTSSTTLQKELDYILVYLAIQKLRFDDRVNYTIDIQEGLYLDDYQILPLLLQPIVENAILHGLEGVENNGQIKIKVREKDEELLLIQIIDNGMGMSPEILEQIKTNIREKEKNSYSNIGLYNINQRIKLCYGEAYGMEIISDTNGTTVALTLPLKNILEE